MSNPDTSFNKSSNEDIDKEVRNLIRKNAGKNKNNSSILEELREKFGNSLTDTNEMRKSIVKALAERKKFNIAVQKCSRCIESTAFSTQCTISYSSHMLSIDSFPCIVLRGIWVARILSGCSYFIRLL